MTNSSATMASLRPEQTEMLHQIQSHFAPARSRIAVLVQGWRRISFTPRRGSDE